MLSVKEIEKKYNDKEKYRVYCKCGHTNYIVNKEGRAECNYCHNLVFKDKETEFKYRMQEQRIREKRKR